MTTYGSVCSGIEAASAAWHPLGWDAAWFSEIEKFPAAVLAHRWPDVANLGDMTKIAAQVRAGAVAAPDVLVGGTPCQAFSVAGLRQSLNDPRGQLTLSYVELANAIDDKRASEGQSPATIVWENVPGCLSTEDNAFGHFLAGLAGEDEAFEPGPRPESGKSSTYWRWNKKTGQHVSKWPKSGCVIGRQRKLAWRVLDAQHFGVAQRRRRVFVVASARNDIDPAKILFEFDGVRRNSPPGRESRQAAAALTANGVGTCGADDNQAQAGHLIAAFGGGNCSGALDVAACLTAKGQRLDYEVETFAVQSVTGQVSHALTAEGFDASEDGTGRGTPVVAYGSNGHASFSEGIGPLRAKSGADHESLAVMAVHGTQDPDTLTELAHTLGRNHGQENAVSHGLSVRRLMPVECERLQGFPDGHTDIPWKNKETGETPDGPRYKAIGNSMAVPVMQWIGQRIGKYHAKTQISGNHAGHGKNIDVSGSGNIGAGAAYVTPDQSVRNKPFFKWVGGKFSVIEDVLRHLPAGRRLIEPFAGGGSVFLNAGFSEVLVNDINPDLILTYRILKEEGHSLITQTHRMFQDCNTPEGFDLIRTRFNKREYSDFERAAAFIYLNRHCFNGLTRYNLKGEFNVGYGKYKKPYFPLEEMEGFLSLADRLTFSCSSFADVIATAGEGDVIFCDPPYEPMPGSDGFTSYSGGTFRFEKQAELAACLKAASQRGAKAVITNSSAPAIIELYQSEGFDIFPLFARRSVSCAGETRETAEDIIALVSCSKKI
ncbi:Dam family site-specific DNA-(adenine-N6)-methyltransferase [Pantoea septica]|uniref:Dam family site-specific DNA-(adenine-N6)-methyltransferase n=1 Tax=Pantoea septica TaxID=472695 RepID=UPI0023F66DDF|nr:Dam family site-specific DNA-(adenine-N6)-methyltransferase [Pantoea septica]